MSKKIALSFAKSAKSKSDTVVVFSFEGGVLAPHAADLDKKAGGLLTSALQVRAFKAKHGDVVSVILPKGGAGFEQALVVGLGAAEKLDVIGYENLGGKIFSMLKSVHAQNVTILLDFPKGSPTQDATAACALACGISLRDYSFDKYKSNDLSGDRKKQKELSSITVVTEASTKAQTLFKNEEALMHGVHLARDLVNEVPNVLYPQSYAAIIKKEMGALGVQVEIFDEKKMEALGFGAHLAVGMGSIRQPRVVIMRWNGASGSTAASKTAKAGKGGAPIAFVGKGVTFDTGGISIKPAAGMEEMKMDMGGSAAVVGLIRALAARKAKVDVVGIVGLAENMPSDRSYRPGDIIKSLSGKTIEVLNTDAEGRLVLCDALTYVQRTYKPKMIIDLATLTGAIMVALGYEYAGAFVNDETLWAHLNAASKASGEKLWRMPLDEAYKEEMKSKVADLQNLGNLGRYGGACSAAGFLEHFIEGKTPWAHLDIAGTAWWKTDKPTVPKGASGFGVRLLYKLVMEHYCQ